MKGLTLIIFVVMSMFCCCNRGKHGPVVGEWGPFTVHARYTSGTDTLYYYESPDWRDYGFYSTENYIKRFPR